MSLLPFKIVALAAFLALPACSQQGAGSDTPAAAGQLAANDAAAKAIDTYRQLQRIHNEEMSVTMGHEILDKYPNTPEAKEVQQSLPAIETRWKQNSEKNRLAGLWQYQVAPMEGGTQSTATIYASEPRGDDRVRLILRRHTEWGQNAFLFGSGHGFVCKGDCTVPSRFDDKKVGIKAFRPPTGEPALMIRNDPAFIAQLTKAKKLSMDVTMVDGEKKQTLVFELGGFDASKWQPLPKGGKAAKKK